MGTGSFSPSLGLVSLNKDKRADWPTIVMGISRGTYWPEEGGGSRVGGDREGPAGPLLLAADFCLR